MSFSQYKKKVRNILFIAVISIYFVSSLLFATIPSSSRNNFEPFSLNTERTTSSSSIIKFEKDYPYSFGIYGSLVQDHSNSYAIIMDVIYFKHSFFDDNYQQIANETIQLPLNDHDFVVNLRSSTNINKYDYFEIRVHLATLVYEISEYISVYGYVDNTVPVYLTDSGWFNFIWFVSLFATGLIIENKWNKYYLTKKIIHLGYSDHNTESRDLLVQISKEKDQKLHEAVVRNESEKEVIKIKQKAEKDMALRK